MYKEVIDRLCEIEKRAEELNQILASPDTIKDKQKFISISQEYNDIHQTIRLWLRYKDLETRISEDEHILTSGDNELQVIAKEEIKELTAKKAEIEKQIMELLNPPDPNDSRNTIIEIRQGTGGDEASIFAADLFRMYSKYAERNKWKVEVLSSHPNSMGGFKEITCFLKGKNAYKLMKYESGVHRVQRIPITESAGRVHTSTATVCVLPEASAIDMHIDPNDLKIDTFRAGGHGGQSVNKVETAVRITHLPTNTVVACQDERSQLQNRERAMKILMARLYEAKREAEDKKLSAERRKQIGSAERSEKIRTYNFPQNRVTDHRINLSLYKLDSVIDGEMDDLISSLENANKRPNQGSNTNPTI
ncbi:MAG: peptide chain release factor 1 [Candidatus Stahlbacteria bacterium]|nr:peptide chain release factor 1 [Candidatus Stahlbacteria bacterium]